MLSLNSIKIILYTNLVLYREFLILCLMYSLFVDIFVVGDVLSVNGQRLCPKNICISFFHFFHGCLNFLSTCKNNRCSGNKTSAAVVLIACAYVNSVLVVVLSFYWFMHLDFCWQSYSIVDIFCYLVLVCSQPLGSCFPRFNGPSLYVPSISGTCTID